MGKTITWLHISDTHLCKAKTGWDAEDIFNALTNDLKSMEKDYDLCPDMIFFTGDLAYGQLGISDGLSLDEQFEEAINFIENVRNAFSNPIPISNIFIVPGNHDVNRKVVSPQLTHWMDNPPDKPNDAINQLIQDGGIGWTQYMERLKDYRRFLEKGGYEHLLQDSESLTYSIVCQVNGFSIGIGGLNSVWSSSRDKEK